MDNRIVIEAPDGTFGAYIARPAAHSRAGSGRSPRVVWC